MANMAKYYMHEIPEGYEARIEGNKVIIELKESEDERIIQFFAELATDACGGPGQEYYEELGLNYDKVMAWLEKQKEPHYTKRNALFDKCVAECDPAVMKEVSDEIDEMLQKEQKPNIELIQRSWYMEGYHDREFGKEPKWIIKTGEGGPKHELNPRYGEYIKKEQKPTSTEDMPYITDEHFYEREPADSFKYKLAEYMTRCCTKKEGPYGHTYAISAESILQMAKEELLKRGELTEQKPSIFPVGIGEVHWNPISPEQIKQRQLEWKLPDDFEEAVYKVANYISPFDSQEELRKTSHCFAEQLMSLAKKELAEKPAEWSEEDEEKLKAICTYLRDYSRLAKFGDKLRFNEYCDFLESLRPQLKQQWSDDDYVCFSEIVSLIRQHYRGENIERGNELINWLKGYEPQPSWKPNEEQMNALNALNCHGDLSYVGQQNQLISLQKDLEKLKGGVAPMKDIDE